MVNRGKQSKDCLPCRRRRVRCDLLKEGCSPCRRAGLRCFGYRDPSDLVVRDETGRTRERFVAQQSTQERPTGLQAAWDSQARVFFFQFYVFGLARTHDTVSALYRQAIPGSHLTESVDAVSLAFLAHHHRSREISALATKKYLTAVQLVNQSLHSPQLARADSTLQSVLLLDLCEKLTNRDKLLPISWKAHVDGALALISARGRRNTQNCTARRLARRLVTTAVISCTATSTRIPPSLLTLYDALNPSFEGTNIKWHVNALVFQLLDLKADINEERLSSDEDILHRAWDLDKQCTDVELMFPLLCKTTLVAGTNDPLVYGGYYRIYQDHFVTQGANAFRTMRLLLHNLIQHHAPIAASRCDGAFTRSQEIKENTAREICASVPQFTISGVNHNVLPFSPIQVFQCYAILPPLYLAGLASKNESLRSWVLFTLKYIADAGKMEPAQRMADLLLEMPEESHHSVFGMLGSYAFAT